MPCSLAFPPYHTDLSLFSSWSLPCCMLVRHTAFFILSADTLFIFFTHLTRCFRAVNHFCFAVLQNRLFLYLCSASKLQVIVMHLVFTSPNLSSRGIHTWLIATGSTNVLCEQTGAAAEGQAHFFFMERKLLLSLNGSMALLWQWHSMSLLWHCLK